MAAAQSWGGTWTLPSEAQWEALIGNCKGTWIDIYDNSTSPYNGMSGYLVTGIEEKFEDGHSILLPAAGSHIKSRDFVLGQTAGGYYWSTDDDRYFNFYYGHWGMDYDVQDYSMVVRPVSE